MLLCTFASARSHPDKIRQWIEYLESLREKHREDPEALRVIDLCLSRAQVWI